MNLVLIADEGPANAWLIRELEAAHSICSIIRPDWTVPRPAGRVTTGSAPIIGSPFARITRALSRRYFARHDHAAAKRLAVALFGKNPLPEPRATVAPVPSWDVNGAATEALLRDAAPDLIIVSGAPMLRANIFGLPRLGTVNLHYGISPEYRGMHTLLVPWQRRDYDHIGATLHTIDEGIDSGPVLFRVYPALTPADDLVSVEAKIARQAASALCGFLTSLRTWPTAMPLRGQLQASSGVFLRFHDRTISAHLADRAGRLTGDRVPVREARIERFYGD